MTQQFLNSPSIEEAYEAYLTRWHLPSVQESWTDKAGRVRRPSLAQFTKRFGSDYEKRQRFLAKRDGTTNGAALAVAERDDVRQQLAELLTKLSGVTTEPEAEILGPDDEQEGTEVRNGVHSILAKLKGETEPEPKAEKFVKPENFDELPTNKQLLFFLHRAIENGDDVAIVPVKRGIIAECISQIRDDGRDYADVASDLISA